MASHTHLLAGEDALGTLIISNNSLLGGKWRYIILSLKWSILANAEVAPIEIRQHESVEDEVSAAVPILPAFGRELGGFCRKRI